LPVVFLIIGGIPLPGGAVMIDHHELKSKKWDTMVSLAGPAMNFVFALIMAVPFLVGVDFLAHPVFWSALAALIWIEVLAAIFNLIPVPGLDGGNALYPWLSHDWRRGFDAVRPYAVLVVFLLLWQTRIARPFQDLVFWVLARLNVPDYMVGIGMAKLLFWKY
jgi:Zn-dependent protease